MKEKMMSDFISQSVCRHNIYMQGLDVDMLNDIERNQFYNKLIKETCKGKIVADIGFGAGLLTMMAIHHGAKHVYAYEWHSTTFDMGKALIEKMGYSDRVTFINKRYDDISYEEHADDIEIVLHELLMRAIWGEGLADISRLNVKTKAQIVPSACVCKVVCCTGHDYNIFGHAQTPEFNIGIDYLKDFNEHWNDLTSSDEYFSFWPENLPLNKRLILEKFTTVLGEYSLDLNDLHIPKTIELDIHVPQNSLVSTLCTINGFQMVRPYGSWRPDRIVSVTEGGRKKFRHRTTDGNWWLE